MLKEFLLSNQQFAELAQRFAKLAQNLVRKAKRPSDMPSMPTELSKQLNELTQKFLRLAQNSSNTPQQNELIHQLGQISQKLYLLCQGKLEQATESINKKLVDLCREYHKGAKIRIEVPSYKIRQAQNSRAFDLIEGKVVISPTILSLKVDCRVACGHWHKLGELKEHTINIVDHLDKLLPKQEDSIGLVTFQNGMMNSAKDFEKMGELITHPNVLPEKPLCIGLYNETTGNVITDFARFIDEPSFNANAVRCLRQIKITFAELLSKINPSLRWLHLAHSEGSLISSVVHTLLEDWCLTEESQYLKKHLITATYGAVKPIADDFVLHAVNTYSKDDIALILGKTYLDIDLDKIDRFPYTSKKYYNGNHYTITVVNSLTEKDIPLVKIPNGLTRDQLNKISFLEWACYNDEMEDCSRLSALLSQKANDIAHSKTDHGFKEKSYQETLNDNIKDFRRRYKIYDAKKIG